MSNTISTTTQSVQSKDTTTLTGNDTPYFKIEHSRRLKRYDIKLFINIINIESEQKTLSHLKSFYWC